MDVIDSLKKIRSSWVARVSNRLARGQDVRQSIQIQLNNFFELMMQAIDSGDTGWLNGILDDWISSRPETELKNDSSSLPDILDHVTIVTHEVASEMLEAGDAVILLGAVLPVLAHAYKYSTHREAQMHIQRISKELEEAKISMDRLDKSKSDFIAIAAHELKTPLTLIEGYTAMLNDRLLNHADITQTGIMIKGINNGTRRLKEIIEDMVDVSMIDNKMLSLKFQPVWISRLLDVIQRDFKEIVHDRNLNLEIRVFPGSQEMTFGDEERLYQAFRNILANAIKYTPDGGNILVDGRQLPGFLETIVKDSGIGIDPEDQGRIFEKFGRLGDAALHSSGKTKFKGGGPGLGLAISRGIIEAHGGAIWVESDGYDEILCPGTTFHILLPLRKDPPDEKIARLFQASIDAESIKEI